MPNKYYAKKLTPNEFHKLLESADVTDTQFQMLTGRHRKMVLAFMDSNDAQAPSLSDLVILGTLAKHPEIFESMMEIAKGYITGDSDSK